MDVFNGELVVVIGLVGVGKFLFMLVVIGEMEKIFGIVDVKGFVVFVI